MIDTFISVDSTTFTFPNNRSILDMCLSKPIGLLALLDEESRFPQSTGLTLLQKWRQNIRSSYFTASPLSNSLSRQSLNRDRSMPVDLPLRFTIAHYAGPIEYTASDFIEKNRDYVPIEIVDILLQSDDRLVRILFSSRLRKTGSAFYVDNDKNGKTPSIGRQVFQQTASINRTQSTVSTYFRYSLMELISCMASTQPTFIRCFVPNRCPSSIGHVTYDHTSYFPQKFIFDSNHFDDTVVREQIRYTGLLETIDIRRRGFSHRILYADFVDIYSCLVNVQLQTNTIEHQRLTCERILKRFHVHDYVMGKTKLFMKYNHIEQLNHARKVWLNKLVRLQSRVRMWLISKQYRLVDRHRIDVNYEQSVTRLQAIVRGFLVRCAQRKHVTTCINIHTYWRMWHDRVKFKHRRAHQYQQQCQLNEFLEHIESSGKNLYEQITNLQDKRTHAQSTLTINGQTTSTCQQVLSKKSMDLSTIASERKLAVLCTYYDVIHKNYLQRTSEQIHKKKSPTNVDSHRRIDKQTPIVTSTSTIPQAPPCPPLEFFQSNKTHVHAVKRKRSMPTEMIGPIDELKRLFIARE
jgi:myosin heavy subunit